ncbi:MAG: class I SAM-dependent methyltransferase [Fulvimarina manganoxydans]|uniref:class I SAM-dependent methyltransferase n=1 Tax=Fulvimarina manganoxydans TaxID=937218 RepID=UPI002354CE86|nr:class I SAM-dependent methyltransferase [Fulvimarina manganoxydans]MCK5933090.1 class I SAM-dependent methyltransferase [Fulvimarina manganoxydans]
MPPEDDNRSQQRKGLHGALSRSRITGPLFRYGISILRLNRTRGLVHGNKARLDHLDRRIDDLRRDLDDAHRKTDGLRHTVDDMRRETDTGRDDAQRQTDELREKVRRLEEGLRQIGVQQTALSQRSSADLARGDHARVRQDARIAALASNVDLVERIMLRNPNEAIPASPAITPASIAPRVKSLLDDFYVAFENRYRGTTEDIASRQAIYLSELDALNADPLTSGPVLDLGCGRGEWLKLLRDREIDGLGLDTNAGQLAEARDHGLAVREGDALAFMRAEPEARYMAVTAFHIVEHLPFETLAEWMLEIRRILKPGGKLIVETPNPETLTVGASTFHMDPTHQKPVPSGLLDVLAETVGFDQRIVRPLHPHPRLKEAMETMPGDFAYLLFGYQDYGFFARRPLERFEADGQGAV